jgi:DNA-binding NarL/FixJ family response regulator
MTALALITRFCEEEHEIARLLIIDDEESLCRVLKIAFHKKGHLVETAMSGQAAERKIESRVYDLIISDIRMPDLTKRLTCEDGLRDTYSQATWCTPTALSWFFHRNRGAWSRVQGMDPSECDEPNRSAVNGRFPRRLQPNLLH